MTTIEAYRPPAGVESTRISPSVDVMTGLETTWCPGCGHGSFTQILADVIHELEIKDKTILVAGVGCGGPILGLMKVNASASPHGRASDVCTGIVRALPDRVVVQYSGDGDSCGTRLTLLRVLELEAAAVGHPGEQGHHQERHAFTPRKGLHPALSCEARINEERATRHVAP